MTEKSDLAVLVEKARGGDRAAFEALIAHTRDELRAAVESGLGSHLRARTEPEDILQETYTRAYESMERFEYDGPGSLLRWLRRIAEHVILEAAKKHRRDAVLHLEREPCASGPTPSRHARREERLERLEKSLAGLSEDHRQVIYLARIEGLKIAEIAERMNRSPSAIGNLLLRAMRQLKKSFGDTESLHLPDRALRNQGAPDERRGK